VIIPPVNALAPHFNKLGVRGTCCGSQIHPMLTGVEADSANVAQRSEGAGREALMAFYAGYGDNILLHGADALVVHRSRMLV
jgi:hypothetical protein